MIFKTSSIIHLFELNENTNIFINYIIEYLIKNGFLAYFLNQRFKMLTSVKMTSYSRK